MEKPPFGAFFLPGVVGKGKGKKAKVKGAKIGSMPCHEVYR
jgi:hypothetical protein